MAKDESVGTRLKRLRRERGLSQRDIAAPGVTYAYISRIESGARAPSVKALRQIASKLGITVEQLETGRPTPLEDGVADAGLEFGSLNARELRAIRSAVDKDAREAARGAALQVIETRRKADAGIRRRR